MSREEQLRIQALGAALSRRDWHATEQAYNAIRDEFDGRPQRSAASIETLGAALDVIMNASCDEQLTAATSIAGNIGMVLVNEPPHPDSPHASPEPDAVREVLVRLAEGCRVKADLYAELDPTIPASFVWIADEIVAALSRLAGGWQEISTAPKDGSVFLAMTDRAQSPRTSICWHQFGKWMTTGRPEKFVDGAPHGWWPTHWQPMPIPLARNDRGSEAQ